VLYHMFLIMAAVLRDTIKWTRFVYCCSVGFIFTAPEAGEINQKPSSRAHSRTVASAIFVGICFCKSLDLIQCILLHI